MDSPLCFISILQIVDYKVLEIVIWQDTIWRNHLGV